MNKISIYVVEKSISSPCPPFPWLGMFGAKYAYTK
jgi:hypothetical protein